MCLKRMFTPTIDPNWDKIRIRGFFFLLYFQLCTYPPYACTLLCFFFCKLNDVVLRLPVYIFIFFTTITCTSSGIPVKCT